MINGTTEGSPSRSCTLVFPVWNEQEVIVSVVEELLGLSELANMKILLMDDGSQDGSSALLDQLSLQHPQCAVVHLPHGGKDLALWKAFGLSGTEWTGIMDADGQYDPCDLARLLGNPAPACDAIWGIRTQRHDRPWRSFISRIGRFIKRFILGSCTVADTGCGLWIARTRFLKELDQLCPKPAGQVHCHIPELIRCQGGQIIEMAIAHRVRRGGCAKYGAWNRLLPGFRSLLQARQLVRLLAARNLKRK